MIYPSFPDFRVVRKSVKLADDLASFTLSCGVEKIELYIGVTYGEQQLIGGVEYQEPQSHSATASVDVASTGVCIAHGANITLTYQQHADLNQYLADLAQDLAAIN